MGSVSTTHLDQSSLQQLDDEKIPTVASPSTPAHEVKLVSTENQGASSSPARGNLKVNDPSPILPPSETVASPAPQKSRSLPPHAVSFNALQTSRPLPQPSNTSLPSPSTAMSVSTSDPSRPENVYISHVYKRFAQLADVLLAKPAARVTIPSEDGITHRLGKGLAVQQWKVSFTTEQYERFIDCLDTVVYQLKDTFGGRVVFGRVGIDSSARPSSLSSSPPSPTNYHVWGANAMNWNLREGQLITGGGMAAAMGVQKEGVFGVVTTPLSGPPSGRWGDGPSPDPDAPPDPSDSPSTFLGEGPDSPFPNRGNGSLGRGKGKGIRGGARGGSSGGRSRADAPNVAESAGNSSVQQSEVLPPQFPTKLTHFKHVDKPIISINSVFTNVDDCPYDYDCRLISDKKSHLPDDDFMSELTATRLQNNSLYGSTWYEQGAFGIILLDQRQNDPRVLLHILQGCLHLPRGTRRDRMGDLDAKTDRKPTMSEIQVTLRQIVDSDGVQTFNSVYHGSGVVSVVAHSKPRIKATLMTDESYYAWVPLALVPEAHMPRGYSSEAASAWSTLRAVAKLPHTKAPRPMHLLALSQDIRSWHKKMSSKAVALSNSRPHWTETNFADDLRKLGKAKVTAALQRGRAEALNVAENGLDSASDDQCVSACWYYNWGPYAHQFIIDCGRHELPLSKPLNPTAVLAERRASYANALPPQRPAKPTAAPAGSNPIYFLDINKDAKREIIRLGLIRSKHDASDLVARAPPLPPTSLARSPACDNQYLSPELDSVYLKNLIDAAQHRACSRGSKVVTPRDISDAAATVAAEGRGFTPQKAPATELPEHYDEMILNLRALGTAAPFKWGRNPSGEANFNHWLPRVLINGEKSGTMARMFQLAGCDVATCDIQRADGYQNGIPHFQGNCEMIQDLDWDLVIGHPPCQYLSNAGGMWLTREEGRRARVQDAAGLFCSMASAKARFVVIEQPKMHRFARTLLGNPRFQYLHPYDHGTGHTKPTGILVTKGELPAIKKSRPVPGRKHATAQLSPSPYRSELRSQTYLGIAGAMAQQWVPVLWQTAENERVQTDRRTARDRVEEAEVTVWLNELLHRVGQDEGDQASEFGVSTSGNLYPPSVAVSSLAAVHVSLPEQHSIVDEENISKYIECKHGFARLSGPENPSLQPQCYDRNCIDEGRHWMEDIHKPWIQQLKESSEVQLHDPNNPNLLHKRQIQPVPHATEQRILSDKDTVTLRWGKFLEPAFRLAEDAQTINAISHEDHGVSRVLPLPAGGPPRCATLPDFAVRVRGSERHHPLPRAILDPGAGASVISMQVLDSLPKGCEIKLNHDRGRVRENLSGVGGSALLVRGTAKIRFNLAEGYGYEHEFIMIESETSILLLGNDFWCRYLCVLTYGTGMSGHAMLDHVSPRDQEKSRVRVNTSFTLPEDPHDQSSVNLVAQQPATTKPTTCTTTSTGPLSDSELESEVKQWLNGLIDRVGQVEGDRTLPSDERVDLDERHAKSGFAPLDCFGGDRRPTLMEEYLRVGPKSKDVLLFSREAINMDAMTTTIVWLEVPEEIKKYKETVMVERMPRRMGLHEQVGVAVSLEYVDVDGRVPVKLINLKRHRVSVAGYTPIARLIMDDDLFVMDFNDNQVDELGAYDKLNDTEKEVMDKVMIDGDNALSDDQRTQIKDLIAAQYTVFAPNPKAPRHTHVEEVVLALKPDVKPHRHQPSRTGEVGRDVVEKQVAELEAHGIIRKSNSAWASRLVLVGKKTGEGVDSVRMCVDYRDLNSKLVTINSPLPRCDEAIDRLSVGAKGSFDSLFVTTLDLAAGFHTLPIREEDKKLTAFCTHRNQYEYNYLPFGINSGPSYMVRLMDAALDGLAWDVCAPFLDDIAIFSHGTGATPEERHASSFAQHKERLRAVLERLTWAGLSAKASKCHFCNTSCDYLGHHVSRKGLQMEAAKVESIKAIDPNNFSTIEDVRSFLGLCSYYRKLIPKFTQLAGPLTDLTKTSEGIDVAAECRTERIKASIATLKGAMISAPVLQMPDFSKEFIVKTDAAVKFGIGGVLSQRDDKGTEHVVAYFSRKLSAAQRNYSVTEVELLAALESMKHWRTYLWGRPFHLIVDHQALKWLHTMQDQVGGGKASRLQRWILSLQEYDFTVTHKPGKDHCDADGLSRLATLPPGDDDPYYEAEDPRNQPLSAVNQSTVAVVTIASQPALPAEPLPIPVGLPGVIANRELHGEPLNFNVPEIISNVLATLNQDNPKGPTGLGFRDRQARWDIPPVDGCLVQSNVLATVNQDKPTGLGFSNQQSRWNLPPVDGGLVQVAPSKPRTCWRRGADNTLRPYTYDAIPGTRPWKYEWRAGAEPFNDFARATFRNRESAAAARMCSMLNMPEGSRLDTGGKDKKYFDQTPDQLKSPPSKPIMKHFPRDNRNSRPNRCSLLETEYRDNHSKWVRPAAEEIPILLTAVLTDKAQHDKNRKERNASMSAAKISDKFLGLGTDQYQTLRDAQAEDPECQALISIVTGRTRGSEHLTSPEGTNTDVWKRQSWLVKEAHNLYVHNEMLYHVDPVKEQKGSNSDGTTHPITSTVDDVREARGNGRSMWIPVPRIYVPSEMRLMYLHAYHDRMGHQGHNRTYLLLRQRYYWPGMKQQVVRYVSECHECTMSKNNQRANSAPQRATIGAMPFDEVVVDILSMDKSDAGYTKVICFVDSLSRWVEAVPLTKDPTTEEAVQLFLTEVVCRHGTPRKLRTDLGSNLCSNMAKHIAEATGYDLASSASEHHQTVGLAERFQQSLVEMTKTVDEGGLQWQEHLPFLLFAYRSTPHRVTELSPAEVLYGRALRHPVQISEPSVAHGLEDGLIHSTAPPAVQEYTRNLSRRLQAAWKAAGTASGQAQEDYVSKEQDHGKQELFQVDDWVLLRIHGKQNKMKYRWSMPKRIARNLGKGNYLIRDKSNNYVGSKQHVSNLRRYSAAKEKIEADEYLIEKLIGRRIEKGTLQYKVKWQGYNQAHHTWEPASDLKRHCQSLMDEYDSLRGLDTVPELSASSPSDASEPVTETSPLPVRVRRAPMPRKTSVTREQQSTSSGSLEPTTLATASARLGMNIAPNLTEDSSDELPIIAKYERKTWYYGRRVRTQRGLILRWFQAAVHMPAELESLHFSRLRDTFTSQQNLSVVAAIQWQETINHAELQVKPKTNSFLFVNR